MTPVSRADRLRCVLVHAHADLTMAGRMLRRCRLLAAWRHARRGYLRLNEAIR